MICCCDCRSITRPAGTTFDRDDGRIAVAAVGHPLLDPAVEHAVFVAADVHPLAAAVRRAPLGLSSSRLSPGEEGKQPSATSLLHQEFVIVLGIKSQERQLEAVLAAGLAVAAAAVAAELREDRDDLVLEVDRNLSATALDADRQLVL